MSCIVNLILLLPRGLRSCCCKVFCYKVRCFLLPLSLFLLLKRPFLLLQSLLAACLRTHVVFECPDSQVFWAFGSLSRSIEEVDSISLEYTIVS